MTDNIIIRQWIRERILSRIRSAESANPSHRCTRSMIDRACLDFLPDEVNLIIRHLITEGRIAMDFDGKGVQFRTN